MKTMMKRLAMWVYCTLAAIITLGDSGEFRIPRWTRKL